MPPSPSPQRSPKDIFHKRGRSFGSILPAKAKDDELLLFTDMQKQEKDNFSLEPAEDFDESISKFSYFWDLKIGGHIATRGENHDSLNVDGDRNDYDWLLTPPQTPLFHSLDDEEDHHVGLARRGRALIKPISVSRSSTMENTRRSYRSSASPNRLSPSPRSCSSTVLTRTRSSNSSSRCSPPLALQPSTPSRRSSIPRASKTLTPPRRSPSPASRSMSTGSSDPMFNGKRGTSPVKANQRSSSARLQGWQSSDPGFSFEAPPNLRTSLSDRPVSRSRGGSPSSFSGLDMGWRGRSQSMSPSPSRRVSSSHSNDQARSSSYSKASVTSSADDDLNSMQSVPNSYSSSPAVRKNLMMKTRTIVSSKKPSKSFSPISAPKRSFNSALWLMSDAIVDTGFPTDNLESSTSRTVICTEELDGSCKYNISSAIECWSAAQAIVNDDSESFGDAAIQNQCTGGMAQEDNLCACLFSSDTEMHSNIPLSLAPEESNLQNAEEGTSATTQSYPIGTPEHADDSHGSDNKLDDCCVSFVSEEAITMELPGDDESAVKVEGSREKMQGCFTLEEATDTILFCSSIVHDIAYRAATIGVECEQKSELASARCPTVTVVEKSIPKGDISLKLPHRLIPKHRKKSEGEATTETEKMEVVAKDPVPVRLVPELSKTSDSMKPRKLESMCNCAIM